MRLRERERENPTRSAFCMYILFNGWAFRITFSLQINRKVSNKSKDNSAEDVNCRYAFHMIFRFVLDKLLHF
jgi:hypothetical protein